MAQGKKLRQSYDELNHSVTSLQNEILALRQTAANTSNVLAALVSLLGEDSVQAEIERMAQEQRLAQESQMAAGVKMLVDANVLKPVAESALGNLIVGVDTGSDGKNRRVQFELKDTVVPTDIMPKFLAQKPGSVIENNGVTMTITEVYEIDRARATEFQAEMAKKAQEAATAAQAVPSPTPKAVPDAEPIADSGCPDDAKVESDPE